jgi:uncharacterized protein YukE
MSDWTPLADEDPLPGDPDEVTSLAGRLGTIGTDIAANTPTLRAIQSQDTWSGDAATEFTDKVGDLPDKLDKVGTRFGAIATALRDYAPVLREAQADARAALAVARQAQDAAARAQSALNGLATARDASTPEPAADVAARAQEAASYRGQLSTANAEMTRAHRMLGDAVGKHRDAEKRAASRIAEAGDDDLKNPHKHFWQKAGDIAHKALKALSAVAGYVAMGCGVIALATCWIPGVDVVTAGLAVWSGAIALGTDFLLMTAYHDKGWKDLAIDALGVIPGGKVLRGAAVAKNGTRVVKAARNLGRAARGARNMANAQLNLIKAYRAEAMTTRLSAGFKSLFKEGDNVVAKSFGDWLRSEYTVARATGPYGAVYRSLGLGWEVASNAGQVPSGLGSLKEIGGWLSGNDKDPGS